MVVFGQNDCIRAKVVVFMQKWLYSVKKLLYSCKVVVIGQSGCIRAKMIVFVQSGFIRAKVVVLGQK